jgi:RNA polymerase sigma-70 factor (ECF subfamily)
VEKFLHDWTPRLYRFALRLTGDAHAAEDLAQEVLLRAWRRRDSLRDPAAGSGWLFRIAVNLWRDLLRRQRSPVSRAGPLPELACARWPNPEQALAHREELVQALHALDSLPARQREVLYLCACEGLKAAEIARVLDVSRDAVKANLSLARKKMRESLGEPLPGPVSSE